MDLRSNDTIKQFRITRRLTRITEQATYHAVTQQLEPNEPSNRDEDGSVEPTAEQARAPRTDAEVQADTAADEAAQGTASDEARGANSASDPSRKERVLHTRVPAVLERELKRFAENLRIPVSNLVRTILEDAVTMADAASNRVEERLHSAARSLEQERERLKRAVRVDPLADVFAFQAVTLAQRAECAKCGRELRPGTPAHLGLSDAPAAAPGGAKAPRLFVCDACLPRG